MDDAYILTEKIYSANSSNEEAFLEEQLLSFMQELTSRKTFNEEGGLQASFVILPNSIGAKVCENNGLAPHQHSLINLVRFLNGNYQYLTIREMSHHGLYQEEHFQLLTTGVEGRIISNEEEITIIMFANEVQLTEFQKNVIQKLVELCKKIRDENIYKAVKVGISTEEFSSEYGELTDEQIAEIKDQLRTQDKKSKA